MLNPLQPLNFLKSFKRKRITYFKSSGFLLVTLQLIVLEIPM